MKKARKILVWLIAAVLLYVGGILLLGTLTDWHPTEVEPADVWVGKSSEPVIQDSVLRFITWNVGYGGLGDADFFFYNKGDFFWTDLGTVRMSEARVTANVAGQRLVVGNSLSDFFLLQEVDTAARRSHYLNELDTVRAARAGYTTAFAPNFKSTRVPLPIFQPWDHYGAVTGGLVSTSRFTPRTSERIPLPGEFPWPTKLFQLDRCALRQAFPTANGKSVVVYNIHLSAYDKDGGVRLQQMSALRQAALADYEAGNYVVVGGDWNQIPPGYNWFTLNPVVKKVQLPQAVPFDFMPPGWKYAYDPTTATVRNSEIPYDSHRTRRSVIDFYLLSPNLRIKQVKGLEMGFKHSDHQPVYLEVDLLD
ncbi:endonuclease/exonuclease/phosphatase family protein [Neolewinella antarctica]|uniref:Endonuclease/exonuclease/phosphatase family metal-dependent hydrolase n=1 Tax=Neolewinella antarctica TaxID=442734 RepID=A0ABX0X8P0_9BACT|nr:endonuclease/exonuclease/phosphatase family protein [Neolewinella antarctica]NJC25324.1 endonuclease/exonuclease/phosphatase family metal-dependent hydrolase [Neolewinella antarctica]